MIAHATPPGSRVPHGLRLGYGVGSFCAATFSTLPGLLLLYYLTNIMAVPAALAAVIVFVPKVLDLVLNPVVGRLSDRTSSRFGPRRPWLLGGACTLPICFALVFAGPPLRGLSAALFVGTFFILASICYAAFEVPYKAMPAEMTDAYHERTALLQWRMVFIGVATGIAGIAGPAIANAGGGTVGSYRLMGVVIAAVLLVAMFGTFFGTSKARYLTGHEAGGTLRAQLAAAAGNRPFRWLVAFSGLQGLTIGCMLAGAPYFATYILHDPGAVSTLFAVLIGPIIVTMPFWVWISRRLDKRGAMILANILYMIAAGGAAATPWFGSVYAHVGIALVGTGYSGFQLLQFSMLADVIALDQMVMGKSRAGVFTGLWTAIEAAVFAFGAVLFGGALAIGGFISSDPEHPVGQPASAITAVLVGETVVPVVLMVLAVLATRKYGITAATMAAAGIRR